MAVGNISPGLLTLGAAFAVVIILLVRPLRILAAIAACVVIAVSGKDVFIKTRFCPKDGTECMLMLQPTWSGLCSASDRSAVLKIEGQYYLAAPSGTQGEASCLDIRFWQ